MRQLSYAYVGSILISAVLVLILSQCDMSLLA